MGHMRILISEYVTHLLEHLSNSVCKRAVRFLPCATDISAGVTEGKSPAFLKYVAA
jgi:hypothetical protein